MYGALLVNDEINATCGELDQPLCLCRKAPALPPAKATKNVDRFAAEGASMRLGGFSCSVAEAYSIDPLWADAAERAKSLDSGALIKAPQSHRHPLLEGEQQSHALDQQNLQTVYAAKVKSRDEVLKDQLTPDCFKIVYRLDTSSALPSHANWQAEHRAAGQPLTLQ